MEKNTCMNCTKKKNSLLDELSYEELEMLENGRSVADYKAGELVYKEGGKSMGLLCLSAGKVKETRRAFNSTEQIVSLKKPVDFLGMRALINNEPYKTSAVALDDASVCVIEKEHFFDVVNNNPELAMKIMRSFIHELEDADDRFINMTQKHLRARLADTLLVLIDIFGMKSDGKTINCTLKRADFAAMSNMTTANVIRTLSAFAKEGIIETEKKNIRLIDHKKLKAISREI